MACFVLFWLVGWIFVFCFVFNSMGLGKDPLATLKTYKMHVNFVESFGDLRADLCSPILDLSSDILPCLHE